jgi:hypothetical protein
MGLLSLLSGLSGGGGYGGGGGGYQQPIILTAPPPPQQQPAFDMSGFEQMMSDMMSSNNDSNATSSDKASTPPTNVSPVLKNDQPTPTGVSDSPGLEVPDPTVPGTPLDEEIKKKGAVNTGGMSVGIPT